MVVEIYTREQCNSCVMAKHLLQERGFQFNEHKLGQDFTREYLLDHFPKAKTFPVIIVDGVNIGGYDNLAFHLNYIQELSGHLEYLREG